MALVSAVERLAVTQTLEDVIAVVRDTARAISGADGVTFAMRDGENCYYIEEDAIGPLWKGRRIPLTDCLAGWCMLNNRTAAVSDIYQDERILREVYRPTFVNSIVMVPVKTEDAIAAIGSYWSEKRAFDAGEIALLDALARSTAAALTVVQMRRSLHESNERLSMALTAGELGTWEMHLPSETYTASPMTRANFGFAPGMELTRETVRAAIHPDDLEATRLAFAQAIRDDADIRIELRNLRPDGTIRWIVLRGRAAQDANGVPVRLSGVCGDVTYRREAKDRMDRLQSDIAHIGRLTEMGEMVSAFAHELRQPLTAANNYLSAAKRFLAREETPTARVNELIAKADEQFRRATQIIQRIRDFAAKSDTKTAPEDLNALIREAVELARLDPRHRGVSVRIDAPRSLPQIAVDKVQILQVLLNLLRNAFEAMEDSKTRNVIVRARMVGRGEWAELSVNDTGPGLSQEVTEKLFQPFVTTKDSGMGVGLSICRTIVENHGGRMWAQSEPGHGASFRLTVPVAERAQASSVLTK